MLAINVSIESFIASNLVQRRDLMLAMGMREAGKGSWKDRKV